MITALPALMNLVKADFMVIKVIMRRLYISRQFSTESMLGFYQAVCAMAVSTEERASCHPQNANIA